MSKWSQIFTQTWCKICSFLISRLLSPSMSEHGQQISGFTSMSILTKNAFRRLGLKIFTSSPSWTCNEAIIYQYPRPEEPCYPLRPVESELEISIFTRSWCGGSTLAGGVAIDNWMFGRGWFLIPKRWWSKSLNGKVCCAASKSLIGRIALSDNRPISW